MRAYPRDGAGVKLDRVHWVEAGGSHARAAVLGVVRGKRVSNLCTRGCGDL